MPPIIEIEPTVAMIDMPRRITATGFAPGRPVEITADLTQNDGSRWRSHATFIADANGSIDLAQDAPLSGDWKGVSSMGLVWAMRSLGAGGPVRGQTEPLEVAVTARGADGERARASFTQTFLAPGVTRTEVRERGLVGVLFTPPGPGPHPALVMLAGSGGGIFETRAALFAAHGYQALALGYFNAPGLPPRISGTKLEYFATALDWIRETLAPKDGFVAVAGVSRGGELSLLLGATYPDKVSAVLAYVPCHFTNGVLNAGHPGQDRHDPTWTLNGEYLPALAANNRTADWSGFDTATDAKRQTPAFLSCLGDKEAMARARIAIERIRGPILFVSGSDDQLWPSETFSEMAERDLAESQFRHLVRHIRNQDAGHTIGFPYVPTTVIRRPHAVSGLFMVYGGTPAGNAAACERSWHETLLFLAEITARP
jgi:pimeloyl-ACP methyl ester carboxylesterase